MKAVFVTRSDSKYDDIISAEYPFPNRLLRHAEEAVGDRIIYQEPTRGKGKQAYVSTAFVAGIARHPDDAGQSIAKLVDFVPFKKDVPFFDEVRQRYYETWLNAIPRQDVGRNLQGKSIRPLSEYDFLNILIASETETVFPPMPPGGKKKKEADEVAREVSESLVRRLVRDANFRKSVMAAYDSTCAVTGMRIINGWGRPEAQAAHIKPVASRGPDSISNGIALSATCHWLFDRHLISIDDDYRLLVKSHKVSAEMKQIFRSRNNEIILPVSMHSRPAKKYIRWHRERFERT